MQRILDQVLQVVSDLREQQQQRLAEMQEVAIELAVTIASHLIQEQIERGQFPVEQLVRRVVERLPEAEKATVYLHPEDLALLHQRVTNQNTTLDTWLAPTLSFAADPQLSRGDCRAETADLQVRSLLDQQIEEVRTHLLNTLPKAENELLPSTPPGGSSVHA